MHFKRLFIITAILQILQKTFVGETFFFANVIDTLIISSLFQDEKKHQNICSQGILFFSLNTSPVV